MAFAEKRGDVEFPWSVKYRIGTNPKGRPIYKRDSGFRTEQAALDHGEAQEADIRRKLWHDERLGEITVDEYFWKKWLPAQKISDKSWHNRAGEYRTHIKPRWGHKTLNDIDYFDVLAFDKHMHSIRSDSTARNVLDLLRYMFEDAAHANLIQKSPMLPRQRTQRGTRKPKTVRVGQTTTIAELLAIGDRLKPATALMALVALFTGMRWGEVSGMRRSFLTLRAADVDGPARGSYVIDPDVGAVHEERSGRRYFGPPKGHKGRTVELPPFLVELLLAHLATFPAERDLLFVNTVGKAHCHTTFDGEQWRQACDGWDAREGRRYARGGIRYQRDAAPPIHKDLWFHDLRHTHKTWLAEDGIEPVARDERLGHVTPGMDGVYVHVTAGMRSAILDTLEKRWIVAISETAPPTWLPNEG